MSTNKNIKQFTAKDIEKYQQGHMTAAERNALEKAELNDPLLSDALEGFVNTPVDINADVTDLKSRLEKRLQENNKVRPIAPEKSKWHYLRIAAILLLMAGAGWFFYQYSLNDKTSAPLATTDQKTIADSTARITAPSASKENQKGDFTIDTIVIKENISNTIPTSNNWEKESKPEKERESVVIRSEKEGQTISDQNKDTVKSDDGRAIEIATDKKESRDLATREINDSVTVTSMGIKKLAAPVSRGYSPSPAPVSSPVVGWTVYQQYLKDSLRVPANYIKKTPAPFVEMNFDVDPSGKPTNYSIISSFSKSASEEAWRLVSQGPLWKPGKASLKIYF